MKRMTFQALGLMVAAVAGGWFCGCQGESHLLIELVPDSRRNSEQQVRGKIHAIEIMLDATGGFRGVPAGISQIMGFEVFDPDADEESELLLRIEEMPADRLPVVDIQPGSNLDTIMAIRARGLAVGGPVVALGGIEAGSLFQAGDQVKVRVPFNLVDGQSAPYVVALAPTVLPATGTLRGIAFYVSRTLNENALRANSQVTASAAQGGTPVPVNGAWRGPIACPFSSQMWVFEPEECHPGPITVGLSLGAGVEDMEGQTLHGPDGQEGYATTFDLTALEGFGPCTPGEGCTILGHPLGYWDVTCEADGSWNPAQCSAAPGSCLDARRSYVWLENASQEECSGFAPGSDENLGSCLLPGGWPCEKHADCQGFGSEKCDTVEGVCKADSCSGSCDDPALSCLDGTGCLPRMGGCEPNCLVTGGCPEFGQQCIDRGDGAGSCQGP